MTIMGILLRSGLFKYYYHHMCTRGPVSVPLSMLSAFRGRLVLGGNGALASRYILSLVEEKRSKYGVKRGENERIPQRETQTTGMGPRERKLQRLEVSG